VKKRLIVIAVLLVAACGREETEPNTTTLPASPPRPRTSTAIGGIIPSPPPPHVHVPNRSTPQKCAGDGSFEQALDCFRMTAGFTFVITDAHGVLAQGEMTRRTPGMERVWFRASGASWIGEAKPSGVVWSRNGKHEQSPPDITNLVWQRTTMVLDPQKKEGAPQLSDVRPLRGETFNHYHFTNANSGEANDVWVSTRDGRITKWTAGDWTLRLR
jgi:hypothetical protein